MKEVHERETQAIPIEGIKTAEEKNYIDPKGYWVDPRRNVRRMGMKGGEQMAVMRATPNCSDAEWQRFYEAIVACLDATKA